MNMPTNELPTVTIVDAPEGWEYERAVSIGLKVWGQACSMVVEPDDVVRFVKRTRGLRKRSTARLFFWDTSDDDTKAYTVRVRHASSGYMLTVEFIRTSAVGDEIVSEKAERSIRLSDEQMFKILADLELAGKVTQPTLAAVAA
ncbi:hypothetical protein [Bradyrhizobium diazoefficiens]|uniref:hypothetical protein n=1 Tax=Bradyrhizobium diazoefficiens TaxID=1355477 RepID=UPI0027153379|nr:hypothetical protein [Bradyrhizobium diazoefficiens]WLB42110.1 hypothetical protein QIH78_20660 [Bradyrhizobium diazoefficiens]